MIRIMILTSTKNTDYMEEVQLMLWSLSLLVTWRLLEIVLMFEDCVLLLHVEHRLLDLVVLADEPHPVGLQLLQPLPHLGLLVLPRPVCLLDILLDLGEPCLGLVEHVLQHLVVNLPALAAVIQHQVEVHYSGALVLQLSP